MSRIFSYNLTGLLGFISKKGDAIDIRPLQYS